MKSATHQGKHSWLKFLLLLAATVVFAAGAHAQSLKVTLLGTGYPQPRMDRFGPSILVEAGNEKLLFDCGRGVGVWMVAHAYWFHGRIFTDACGL